LVRCEPKKSQLLWCELKEENNSGWELKDGQNALYKCELKRKSRIIRCELKEEQNGIRGEIKDEQNV
jgi:hypothetical protein